MSLQLEKKVMSTGRKLITNTILFTINAIGSKLMVFFLVPLYTHYMSSSEYGIADLVNSTVSVLLFLGTLKINSAVLRFAVSEKYDRQLVFNNALLIVNVSSLILSISILPVVIVFNLNSFFFYIPLLYFTHGLKDTAAQYCKAIGKTKIYAVEGILSSMLLLVLSTIFLAFLHWNIQGYLIPILITQIFSIIFLYHFGQIRVMLKGFRIKNTCMKEMLSYSIPLVPNSLAWWIVQLSDRYMVAGFISSAANGVYTIAYKIPSMMGVAADIFIQAWILSVIGEYDGEKDYSSFSRIYSCYEALLFILSSVVICINVPIANILYGTDFIEASKYSPLLVFALLFNNIQAFFGSFYSAAKKTKHLLYSSIGMASTNVVLNLCLIPFIGIYGAIISTCISYILIAVLRLIGSRRYVSFELQYSRLVCNSILLLMQALNESFNVYAYPRIGFNLVILLLILFINKSRFKYLLEMFMGLLKEGLSKLHN